MGDQLYWENVEVMALDTKSGISDMPMTDKECIQGAINRAKNSTTKDVDFSVGAEGGALDTEYGMFVFAWAAVLDKKGNMGLGNSGRFLIPEKLASRIRIGEELGEFMDDVANIKNVRKNQGAVGVFTKDVINRTQLLEHAIVLALVKYHNEELYELK